MVNNPFIFNLLQARRLTGNGEGKNIRFIGAILLAITFPRVAKALKVVIGDPEVFGFFIDVVKTSIAHRKATGNNERTSSQSHCFFTVK